MAELLTLTTPDTKPTITTWRVKNLFFDVDTPSIKVDIASNTGESYTWRYVVSETVTVADIRTALSFINQGKFMVNQGKSLQKWILDRMSTMGVKVGTVSGAVD
jgi:hypothetical protein